MKRKLAGVAITMLVAALGGLTAGCGGGGKGTAGTATAPAGPPLTKAAFITRADAICRRTSATIRSAAAKLRAEAAKTGTVRKDKVAKFLKDSSLPAYDRQLDGLRELTPPKADEQAIDALVASLAGAIDSVKVDPTRYTSRTAVDPFDDFNGRARRYGMKACGS
jgi:hypothetical protein